jgi:hypothetical protein
MSKLKIPWTFLKSTFIVTTISFLAALGIKALGGDFWAAFALFFTIQYILFSFIASIAKNYFIQKTRQKELDVLEPLSTILECAYCNTSNIMTFLPDQNERAEFVCTSCTKTNLVNIQFTVARITEPVVVPNATGIPLQDEKQ